MTRSTAERTCFSLLSLLSLLSLCCGGGSDSTPSGGSNVIDPPPVDRIASGWDAFESGDMDGARLDFLSALDEDPVPADAHNGLGWTYALLDSLLPAAVHFQTAVGESPADPEPLAGMALISYELPDPDYDGAIDAASTALTLDTRFLFDHDSGFDWIDLRLILAQSYFALTNYSEAAAQLESLGIAPPDTASASYVADLLEGIQSDHLYTK